MASNLITFFRDDARLFTEVVAVLQEQGLRFDVTVDEIRFTIEITGH